jgi:hypothetical protein
VHLFLYLAQSLAASRAAKLPLAGSLIAQALRQQSRLAACAHA